MITGAIRNKVDKIWTDIWAGGIANPLTVIEQLTYLMFIRSLDEKELENEEFENMTGEQMPKIFPQSEAGRVYAMTVKRSASGVRSRNFLAARSGPMVWELDGPLPILYKSRSDFMAVTRFPFV